MKNKAEPKYWGSPNDEQFMYKTKDEAIESILDSLGTLSRLQNSVITVVGVAPMHVFVGDVLDDLLDRLDEEYGEPDGDPTEATEEMKLAEAVFLVAIQKLYVPWMCEEVVREDIDIESWIKAHRPDWLVKGVEP